MLHLFKVNVSGSPSHRRTELEAPARVDSQTKDAHQLSDAQKRQDTKPLGGGESMEIKTGGNTERGKSPHRPGKTPGQH